MTTHPAATRFSYMVNITSTAAVVFSRWLLLWWWWVVSLLFCLTSFLLVGNWQNLDVFFPSGLLKKLLKSGCICCSDHCHYALFFIQTRFWDPYKNIILALFMEDIIILKQYLIHMEDEWWKNLLYFCSTLL